MTSRLAELEQALTDEKARILASPYPHGPCECTDGCHSCASRPGPVMFEVTRRDGRRIKVCFRCDLSSDRERALLVQADEATEVYEVWDDWAGIAISAARARSSPPSSNPQEKP